MTLELVTNLKYVTNIKICDTCPYGIFTHIFFCRASKIAYDYMILLKIWLHTFLKKIAINWAIIPPCLHKPMSSFHRRIPMIANGYELRTPTSILKTHQLYESCPGMFPRDVPPAGRIISSWKKGFSICFQTFSNLDLRHVQTLKPSSSWLISVQKPDILVWKKNMGSMFRNPKKIDRTMTYHDLSLFW